MEFSLAEKLALIRAVEDVIEADGRVNIKEVEIMKQLSYFLNFDMNIVEEARKLSRAECSSGRDRPSCQGRDGPAPGSAPLPP
jgi:hypothetical protein